MTTQTTPMLETEVLETDILAIFQEEEKGAVDSDVEAMMDDDMDDDEDEDLDDDDMDDDEDEDLDDDEDLES